MIPSVKEVDIEDIMEWQGLGIGEGQKTGRKEQGHSLWNAMEKMMYLEDLQKSSKTLYLKQARDESTKKKWCYQRIGDKQQLLISY